MLGLEGAQDLVHPAAGDVRWVVGGKRKAARPARAATISQGRREPIRPHPPTPLMATLRKVAAGLAVVGGGGGDGGGADVGRVGVVGLLGLA
eukprot:12651049-Alexandrium_andersonii.AAC.1